MPGLPVSVQATWPGVCIMSRNKSCLSISQFLRPEFSLPKSAKNGLTVVPPACFYSEIKTSMVNTRWPKNGS